MAWKRRSKTPINSPFSLLWQVVDLETKQLEFRGIKLSHLQEYFLELGGTQVTDRFPIHFEGENWQAAILSEQEVKITSTFIVNAVHIRFSAKQKEKLDDLIKQYRLKTTRIGG